MFYLQSTILSYDLGGQVMINAPSPTPGVIDGRMTAFGLGKVGRLVPATGPHTTARSRHAQLFPAVNHVYGTVTAWPWPYSSAYRQP